MEEIDKKSLENYFKAPKRAWYSLSKDNEKVWNRDEVILFWERIRNYKVNKKDLDFSDFVFPGFDLIESEESYQDEDLMDNFFVIKNSYVFESDVNFYNATFLGNVDFSDYKFKGKTNFTECTFHGGTSFSGSEFSKKAVFLNANFHNVISFSHCIFEDTANFKNTVYNDLAAFFKVEFSAVDFLSSEFNDMVFFSGEFNGKIRINNSSFKGEFELGDSKFLEVLDLSGNMFSDKVTIYKTEFINKVDFSYSKFHSDTRFINLYFRDKVYFKRNTFDFLEFVDINRKKEGVITPLMLHFNEIYFGSKTFFTKIDINKVQFYNCDLSRINFSKCLWNITKGRLLLKNEERKISDSEEHYRQLKKNFDSMKYWELSGYAYVSEMEMRKRSLWKERNYFEWIIYSFYGNFGGYTQNIKKPIVSLLGLIFLFSIIFYFIDYNWLKAIQRGIKGALPYIQIDTENPFNGYWLVLRNIEFLLGATFLTFFILALRKRFK